MIRNGEYGFIYDSSNPHKAPERLFGQFSSKIISASISDAHILILCEDGKVYGIGSNTSGELTGSPSEDFQIKKLLPIQQKVFEIAAGNGFSCFITEESEILSFGNMIKFEKYNAPRYLNATENIVAFVSKVNTIHILINQEIQTFIVGNNPIISLAISNEKIAALNSNQEFFIHGFHDAGFLKVEVLHPNSIFSGPSTICIKNKNNVFFELKDNTLEYFSNDGIALTRTSRHDIIGITNKCAFYSRPLQYQVSCFSQSNKRVLFIVGNPISPIESFSINLPPKQMPNDFFYSIDSRFAYFSHKRVPTSESGPILKKIFYHTATDRFVPNLVERFKENLLINDKVRTPSGVIGFYKGHSLGHAWISLQKDSNTIYAVNRAFELAIVERPGHQIVDIHVDSQPASIDVTPSFCEQYGLAVGDLIWAPKHGIVEVIGIWREKFVLRDFTANALFSACIGNYKIMRTFVKGKTRKVLTSDFGVVDVDICAINRPFMPSDVVSTPQGDGIVVGFYNHKIYVEFLGENRSYPFSLSELTLIRRIGMPAVIDGVSHSTLFSVRGIIPGDVISFEMSYYKVIGIKKNDEAEELFLVDAHQNKKVINNPFALRGCSIIYRPDMKTCIVNINDCEVGSPAYSLSRILPGDTIITADEKILKFNGIGTFGPVFINTKLSEKFETPYSALLTSRPVKQIVATLYGKFN